ncbi:MAG: hypothetical protein ACJA2E_000165 [Arenicella sp.]|jgi:hypothetical protein
MNNSTTLKLAASLLTAGLIFSANSNASEVDTAGQAMTLCTAQAEKAHPGYQRSKSTKIKLTRGVFKIKMKVVTEGESLTTFCEVTRDGTVSYAKA